MLSEKIKQLYSSLQPQDFLTVITLQNDSNGAGDYIKAWNHPEFPMPTQEQLDAVK